MNILVDRLPTELEVNGVVYKIDPDFRPCLRTILAFEDPDLAVVEKNLIFYDNLYIERPPDMAAALKMGQWFLNAGKEYEEDNGPRVFSWTQDADLIYAGWVAPEHLPELFAEGGEVVVTAEEDIGRNGARMVRFRRLVQGVTMPTLADIGVRVYDGKVVAVGAGRVLDDGKRAPMSVKKGQTVIYAKYGGTEVTVDGKDFVILDEDSIFAVKD